MKKISLCIISLLSAISMFASANMVVQWYAPDGFIKEGPGDIPLLNNGGNTVAFLIFSPSGSFWNQPLVAGSFTIGDEVIVDGPISVDYIPGDPYGYWISNINIPYTPGVMYARVFDEGTTSNPASVTNGLWYWQSRMVTVIDTDVLNPQFFNVNEGSANIPGYNTDQLNRQVVPEPATLAILALGAAVVAIRRKVRE